MLIKSSLKETKFIRKTKNGFSEFKRTKLVCHFECDNCGTKFDRDASQIAEFRRNNGVKHFCSKCSQPSVLGKIGNLKRNKLLQNKYLANIGNKFIDSRGYVHVCVGNQTSYSGVKKGYIYEHAKVMQDHIGRPLAKGEVVHHIDGDKKNNNISNLDLCSVKEHNNAHAKAEQIVFELVKQGKVLYDRKTKRYILK